MLLARLGWAPGRLWSRQHHRGKDDPGHFGATRLRNGAPRFAVAAVRYCGSQATARCYTKQVALEAAVRFGLCVKGWPTCSVQALRNRLAQDGAARCLRVACLDPHNKK